MGNMQFTDGVLKNRDMTVPVNLYGSNEMNPADSGFGRRCQKVWMDDPVLFTGDHSTSLFFQRLGRRHRVADLG